MLNWLRGLIDKAGRGLEDLAGGAVSLATQGIAAVLQLVFGNVSSAWSDLEQTLRYFDQLGEDWLGRITGHLLRIITYDIPHYAMQALWWIEHPQALANWLGWHVVRFLEDHAWEAGRYLGEFVLALVLRNVRRVAQLAEQILTAIL